MSHAIARGPKKILEFGLGSKTGHPTPFCMLLFVHADRTGEHWSYAAGQMADQSLHRRSAGTARAQRPPCRSEESSALSGGP